jgi:hypothetical protein
LNLLQAQSFRLHNEEKCEEEGDGAENSEQPESAVAAVFELTMKNV